MRGYDTEARLRILSSAGESDAADRVFTPLAAQRMWGARPKLTGVGSRGFAAVLWDTQRTLAREASRPAYPDTHVVSVWMSGSVTSEVFLNGKRRYRGVRHRGTFQLARASEDLRVALSAYSGKCLDIYLTTHLIAEALLDDVKRPAREFELLPAGLEKDPFLTRLADAIETEMHASDIGTRLALDSAALALSAHVMRKWSNFSQDGKPVHVGGLAPAQFRRTLDLMNAHAERELSLKMLADNVGLSVYHFARAFKQTSGVSPYRYVTQLRLSAACDLIKSTGHSITEIAHMVGYGDAGAFSRTFRNELGMTPREYRHRFGKN